MFDISSQDVLTFLHHWGYLGISLIIAGESMGIPLPGETVLVVSSIFAATKHFLNIYGIVTAAIVGAIIGDNLGYLIGKYGGFRLFKKYGKYVGVNQRELKVGQYLFMLYGGKIVFFGRFFSILRTWAAFLAGVNKMPWRDFLIYNAGGAIVWASFYGTLAYTLGKQARFFSTPLRTALFIIGTAITIGTFFYVRHNINKLAEKAEKAIPGPLH